MITKQQPKNQELPPQTAAAGTDKDGKVRASYALDRTQTSVPIYWRPTAMFSGSATLMAAGGLAVQDSPHLIMGTIACTAASIAATGLTARNDVRREVDAALRATVERMTGPLRRWRCRRWNGGLIGSPKVIKLRYRPQAIVGLAGWPAPLTKAISQMLHTDYQVAVHDPALGKLVLRRKAVTADEVVKSRADRIMAQLFGDDVHVKRQEDGSKEIITVTYSNVLKAADPKYREAVEHVVDVALPGRWRAQWNPLNDQVRFEVRPPLPKMLKRRPPNLDPTSPDFLKIPLGEDEDGNVTSWNLKSSQPHLLLAGKTGKGKTNLLLGVGQELSARQIAVWACDPKRIELQALRSLPNVQIVATTPEDMAALVVQAYNEMERRYKLIETGKAKKGSFPRLVIMVDEFAEFAMRIQSWWASIKITGMPTKCPVTDMFESLLRLCRAADMNIVAGLQRPDVRFLSGEARDNCDARVSLGPLNRDGSDMMWGSQIGCTTGLARGRAMATGEEGEPREIQTYWTPDKENDDLTPEVIELLDSFKTDAIHPPLRISIPDPEEDDKGRELWWPAIQDSRMIIDDTPKVEEICAPDPKFGQPTLRVVPDLDVEEDDSYGNPVMTSLDDIDAGDLYWRDDSEQWVQVKACEPDPVDQGLWDIAWESGDGEDGTDLVPEDSRVRIKRLI